MAEAEPHVAGADGESLKPRPKRTGRRVAVVLVVLLLAIQLVPYGRGHTNPPVTAAVAWNSSDTESLVRRACFDCHSNETRWPWYSHVAPSSWLVQSDVDEARTKINFSEGNLKRIGEVADEVTEGGMPPWYYRLAHREARLSSQEKQALVRGIGATFGGAASGSHDGPRSEHDGD